MKIIKQDKAEGFLGDLLDNMDKRTLSRAEKRMGITIKKKIMQLTDFNGKEIKSFNNDEVQVAYIPNPHCKFILQHEKYYGEYECYDKVFILHLDENNREIERWNALSSTITFIRWA
jgi:hypothetical protein